MPGQTGDSESLKGKGEPLSVLQFTDTHFFGTPEGRLMGVDTSETFRQVFKLAHEKHGAPDFYLLTGDLSQDETQLSYERFADAARDMRGPAYYLPGNHDARPLMQAAFAGQDLPFRHDEAFTYGAWNIVLLDTQVEGEVGGRLSEAELERLDVALAKYPEKHALVSLHHHPLPVGSSWIDSIKVDNSDEFFAVLDRHPQVRMVLCGHIHQEFEATRGSVRYFGSPSTCVQFKPNSNSFAVDVVPPGFRWLQLNPDGTIDTQVTRVQTVARGLDYASSGY